MLDLANVTTGDTVYDLGCGDGRIVISAAKKYGARGVGIDINPARIEEARTNARSAGVTDLVNFEVRDLFDAEIRNATVVALYSFAGSEHALASTAFA
jgi:cyclopropane fatty-acyl-phospholipid synthase-like methyltransferase